MADDLRPLTRDETEFRGGADGDRPIRSAIAFLDELATEVDALLDIGQPNPHLRIAAHVMQAHLDGRLVTPSAAIAAAGVPYATAVRRIREMQDAGLIDQRAKTKTGRSYTLHPSPKLIGRWTQLATRLPRLAAEELALSAPEAGDYYYGGSYQASRVIPPLHALPEPLKLAGGLRILVHGDPTFMVMDALKRHFEAVIGTTIGQRAFSIDRLRQEALRNAERRVSRYDIIAVDLPWIGEFAAKGVLQPLDEIMAIDRLDPADFHTAGWMGSHWAGRPYAVPSQTTPELLFYRKDLFAEAGLAPPHTLGELLSAARAFHDPDRGRYGIAWNAARGTALGHQFLMACADFGQAVIEMPKIAGGYDTASLSQGRPVPTIDTPAAHDAAAFLLELLAFSPPDILSMSWYERVRPYAAGRVPMSYGYTLLAPYFELDPGSPARGTTGYLPHPAARPQASVAPVGGYSLGIPANIDPARRDAAVKALVTFTSAEAQKLYVQNGSRTIPRYSVGADPEVRRLSTIFEAVDQMSWRDQLQFWPRPPIPEIHEIFQICGEEIHDMLRGVKSPDQALGTAQARAEYAIEKK